MATISRGENAFTRAVIISVSLHIALFILILLSPYLPKSSKKGMIHYVNVISFGGGGGGGSGGGGLSGGGNSPSPSEEKMTETSVQKRDSLRDLTTPQNLKTQNPPSMTYPVDKPKREKSSQKPKKTVIKKSSNSKSSITNTSTNSGESIGNGSGLRIGVGNGSGGGGGSEFAGQIGLSNFPYTYYLQNLHGKISSNWLTAQIQTGLSGTYHTTVLFKIFRNGRISDPKIVESSGVRTMDLSAIRAVRDASPFPPLPPGYEDEYLQIRLIFEHDK